jgi:hypothetical protein
MGISPLHAGLILMEHKRRRLPQTVHLLGRQTVILSFERACAMIRQHGIEPATVDTEIDRQTVGALASQQPYITDKTFFGLLGVRNVVAIDHSAYEGANLIIDLNRPLPRQHEASVDFLYGGSVVDNIFNPAAYLQNVARLLKPGGRLFEQTQLSQHHHPYALLTPAWFQDFFTVNRFRSCMMYVGEYAVPGFAHMYGVVPRPDDFLSDFGPPRDQIAIGLTIFAEKGDSSTWDELPSQDQYRNLKEADAYKSALAQMQPPLFAEFSPPTSAELLRLGLRQSKSYRYLGVYRLAGPLDFSGEGIRIVEASYGLNCASSSLTRSALIPIYNGNVTAALASMANGLDQWQWVVDVNWLGDPAPSVPKALEVRFCHSGDKVPQIRTVTVPAEAHGQVLTLVRTNAPQPLRRLWRSASTKIGLMRGKGGRGTRIHRARR